MACESSLPLLRSRGTRTDASVIGQLPGCRPLHGVLSRKAAVRGVWLRSSLNHFCLCYNLCTVIKESTWAVDGPNRAIPAAAIGITLESEAGVAAFRVQGALPDCGSLTPASGITRSRPSGGCRFIVQDPADGGGQRFPVDGLHEKSANADGKCLLLVHGFTEAGAKDNGKIRPAGEQFFR